MSKGRKYFVVDNAAWESLKSQALAQGAGLQEAKKSASEFASAADDENPGKEHSFAIVEEAGVLSTTVEKKVNQNFSTSRSIIRKVKPEASEDGDTEATASESTGKRRGRKRKNQDTEL